MELPLQQFLYRPNIVTAFQPAARAKAPKSSKVIPQTSFEKRKRWKKTKYKVPTMRVFKDTAEIAAMIERDHLAECAKYNEDGSLK